MPLGTASGAEHTPFTHMLVAHCDEEQSECCVHACVASAGIGGADRNCAGSKLEVGMVDRIGDGGYDVNSACVGVYSRAEHASSAIAIVCGKCRHFRCRCLCMW